MIYLSEETLRKARAGASFVPIRYTIGGIKVYKKTILFKDIVPHMQKLLFDAFDTLQDLQDESPKGKTVEELINSILTSQSGFLGKPITNRDISAYSLSKLTECVAILQFMGKA